MAIDYSSLSHGVSNSRWGFQCQPIAKNQKEGSAICKREILPTPPCRAKSVQPQGGNKWNWPTIRCKLASNGPEQNIRTGGIESEYYQIKCTQVFEPEIVAEHKSPKLQSAGTQLDATCPVLSPESGFPKPEVAESDHQTERNQDRAMHKTCCPHTTPSQQNKKQATKCPKALAQMFCKPRFCRNPHPQRDAKSNPQQDLWNACCGHQTQGFPPRKPQKRRTPNKEMSKNRGPQTTPNQQNKIQTTKPLAPAHFK